MIKITITFIILAFTLSLFGQEKNEYPSKEQEQYNKHLNYKPFSKVEKSKILNYRNKLLVLKEIDKYKPYNNSLYFTPYQDSIFSIMYNPANIDSMIFPKPEFIGKIEKSRILKYEKEGAFHAFVYSNYKFENGVFGEEGIWIAISNDNGENWNYYYTGIVQRQPLYLKWYSEIPMIVDNNNIQIEAVLLQQQNSFIHPGPKPEYKIIKDGISVLFELNLLTLDSDNDGLTDVVENKLHTNIANKDTDNDGIPDSLDLNPRIDSKRMKLSIVYETIINGNIPWDTTGIEITENESTKRNFVTDTTETIMIVTDNPDLINIQPNIYRVILITEKEYKKFKSDFQTGLKDMHFTPSFKVDDLKDTYIINRSFETGGERYLVKKTKKGWRIKLISMWIS